ncbi:MAG: hypothetical protein B7C24_04230 [Bacteroidetes bacterium 4572_77]|nr:MAG: hypothetical protein B7C24_04230 [Bacteroidetes bacterium 4572_77]
MENQFNFLNQPLLSALQDAANLLPSLSRVDLLSRNKEARLLEHTTVNGNKNEHLSSLKIPKKEYNNYLDFRKRLKGAQWNSLYELPFYKTHDTYEDSNIFDEILKSVLCIGFENHEDRSYDVFIFYFKLDASEFGPIKSDNVLDTNQKLIIERLLFSSLQGIIKSYRNNQKAMIDFNSQIRVLLDSKQKMISAQEKQIIGLNQSIDAVLNAIIRDFKQDGEIIKLSDKAREKLRPYLASFEILRKNLKLAITFARTLHYGNPQKEIVIQEDYFSDLDENPIQKEEGIKADPYSIDTKTYKFLDALEGAAEKLLQKGEKLTSTKVGQELLVPVSAAAISDKLKNHKHKVNMLLQQYPQHWKIIRFRFRPIVNVQERADERVA